MKAKISKGNPNEALIRSRLLEVRMSGSERMQAEAELARAEAIAEFAGDVADRISRLLRNLVLRPYRKLTASLG